MLNTKKIEVATGIINLTEMNTNPGNNNPFSPPPCWIGGKIDYIELMRDRNRTRTGYQQIYVAAKQRIMEENVTFHGPFKEVADNMLNSLCKSIIKSH